MKKIVLLLSSLFSLVCFTNCGGSAPQPDPDPLEEPLSFTCLSDEATLTFFNLDKCPTPNDPEPEPQPITLTNLEYSLNSKDNWIAVPQESLFPNFPKIELKKDDTAYFRGDNPQGMLASLNFTSKLVYNEAEEKLSVEKDGELEVKGNIMSLISKQNFSKLTKVPEAFLGYIGCFAYLFDENLNIVDASKLLLPAQVSSHCYESMFSKCENLRFPPKLDATLLAQSCYANMFSYCKSLEEAPYLPATTLVDKCYSYMFNDCDNLNYVKVGFGTPGESTWPDVDKCTFFWLDDVASTGTFEWKGATEVTLRDEDTVPSGWTIKTIE